MPLAFEDQISAKSVDELKAICAHPHNYQAEFVRLAQTELAIRGVEAPAVQKMYERKLRQETRDLQKGKAGSPLYLLLCFVLALFGGIIAIYAGYVYSKSTLEGADGNRYYVYDDSTRQAGNWLMIVGGLAFAISLILAMQ